jgi:hypothetical protein
MRNTNDIAQSLTIDEHIYMNEQDSNLVSAIKGMLTEVEYAWAHNRIYTDLKQALLSKTAKLARYSDFFDITVFAHFCGMILVISHLLDRDERTQSIYWLLSYVENHPTEFGTSINAQDLRSRLGILSVQKEKIRRIRNQRVAHTERMTSAERIQFWASIELTSTDVQHLLTELGSIIKEVTNNHKEYDWRWVMIAIDEETSELIDALMHYHQ